MLILPLGSAIWIASEPAKAEARLLVQTFQRCNVKHAVAAHYMGLSEAQLSDQLACRQPLNFFRLVDLFAALPEVKAEYMRAAMEADGWRVMRDVALLKLVDAVQALCAEQRKPMAKASLRDISERKQA